MNALRATNSPTLRDASKAHPVEAGMGLRHVVARFGGLGVAALMALAMPAGAQAQNKAMAAASRVEGVVTQVIDGETLIFTPTGRPALRVRLRDIDAPEPCQPWGAQAQHALSEWALNKPALLRAAARAGGADTLGVVMVDEASLGVRMVEEGHAWSVRGRNDRGPLVKQERMAIALKRGLHAAADAIPPAEFRRRHGPCPSQAPQR